MNGLNNLKRNKMKNIHVIPTDKPSRLCILSDGILQLKKIPYLKSYPILSLTNQHIYITSDEEIKEENLTKSIYVIDVQNGNIGKLTCKNRFFKGSCKLIGIEWSNKQDIWNYYHIKEIILTTDVDLIKDGVQAIDDEFLEWFVKNPSCEKVEVESNKCLVKRGQCSCSYQDIDCQCSGYKIVIPKEEPKQETLKNVVRIHSEKYPLTPNECYKQETLEEAAEKHFLNSPDAYGINEECRNSFIEGAKWQQERMYSEEDLDMFRKFMIQEQNFSKSCLDVFVEQFKKK
jgi:hypothetical protein